MGKERVFRFKQFHVVNDVAAMRVNTDGVLLGAWCDVAGARRVLDVGTGSGVIALMVAQRNAVAQIDAVDIDAQAVAVSRENFAQSPWADRLVAVSADFNAYIPKIRYDLIVSNPPYFDNGVLPAQSARAVARHSLSLSLDDLITHSAGMLAPGGRLALIAPASRSEDVERIGASAGLHVRRVMRVSAIVGQEPKRVAWEWTNEPVDEVVSEDLAMEERSMHYTAQYRALCSDFYLKM